MLGRKARPFIMARKRCMCVKRMYGGKLLFHAASYMWLHGFICSWDKWGMCLGSTLISNLYYIAHCKQ